MSDFVGRILAEEIEVVDFCVGDDNEGQNQEER